MWFKTVHAYRLHGAAAAGIALDTLTSALAEHTHRPVSSAEARRLGWYPPAGRQGTQLVHEIQGHRLLTVLRQERILPASVIREEVEERVAEREATEGRPVPRRDRQAIKEQVIEELLPRAFTRTQRIDMWWDTDRALIAINAASRTRAEEVLDLLRQSLGSLQVTPLAVRQLPSRTMTNWVHQPKIRPAWLRIGEKAVLEDSHGDDGKWSASGIDIDADDTQSVLAPGRQVTRLQIEIDERVTAMLHDDLTLKSIRFADALLDEASQVEDDDDPIMRLETDFALMTGALRECIEQLIDGLGGEADPATEGLSDQWTVRINHDGRVEGIGGSGISAEPQPFGYQNDPLYPEAVRHAGELSKTSVSGIQRHFKIGYNRACHLVEAMEAAGIVTPMDNQGRRRVITTP
ncbi:MULTISPECIES: recombination-associated protein RdgC [Chromohalobacter]|uniref:recombination-associated protein RdgC n=1 Tax=Chromohalobacter TaxID=42054 RepID=UPI00300E4F76